MTEKTVAQTALWGRVLIADDDTDFRALLARRATRMGLKVTEAPDGSAALEAINQDGFQAIVLDVYMPGASGLEVAQAARERDKDVQVIILTGSSTVQTAIDALRLGVYDYFTKPLDSMEAFELSLRRSIEHYRLLKENARLFSEVQRLAVTDPLTGLYNRHKLNETLEVEIERSRRYQRALALILLDLDGLKQINDTRGHPVGDAVLVAAAQAIRSVVRKVDLVTRIGGDEFLVLLPEADAREAERVAQRVFERFSALSVQGERVSASAGVAAWTPVYQGPAEFLEAADQALYQAKREGGGTLVVARHPTLEAIPEVRRIGGASVGR